MIFTIINAMHVEEYKVFLQFNTGDSYTVDLESTIKQEPRKIFFPLKDIEYFKTFKIHLNTITWENEADFAPEFLLELGKKQSVCTIIH